MKYILCYLLLLVTVLWAEKSDTLPSFDTTGIHDTISSDTTTEERSDTTQENLQAPTKALLIGVNWSFGNSKFFQDWSRVEKEVITNTLDSLNDKALAEEPDESKKKGKRYSHSYLQKPAEQLVAFPISLGYYHQIDSFSGLYSLASYSYQKKRSVYTINNSLDTNDIYREASSLSHHQTMISLHYERLFDPLYFSVAGVKRTGIAFGAGAIPYFQYTYKKEGELSPFKMVTKGYGALWDLTLFTDKVYSNHHSMVRFLLGYRGVQKEISKGAGDPFTEHTFKLGVLWFLG